MATSALWVTSVLMAVLTVSQHVCETIKVQEKSREVHPQKMVEIIELMLSQRPNSSDNKKGFGIQRVPQEGAPNYEILITPNKNLQELKGSQKIKIFVEAADYVPEEKPQQHQEQQESKRAEEPEQRGRPSAFGAVPLSIDSAGLNVQHYQQAGGPAAKLHDHEEGGEYPQKDFESFPSKRQTNWSSAQKARSGGKPIGRQADIKEVVIQREPSYVDQNNPYHPVSSTKKEERPRVPTYDGDYSSSSQNGKRVPQQTYVDEYASLAEEPPRSPVRPGPKEPKRTYETAYEEKPIYEESRPGSDRRPTNRDPEEGPPQRRPPYGRDEVDARPSESRNPAYEDDRRPAYGREESRPSGDRRPTYARDHEKPRPYPEYDEERPVVDREPVYSREPPETESHRRPPYEKGDGSGDINRPVREDSSGYAGFPESYQPDINNHYSRPLQYEPARVFPPSPCLNVFKYEGREPEEDRWYADIYVSTDEILNGMRLDVRLDRPAEILTNWLAEVKTKDSMHFTLLSLTHRLVPGPPETVRIMVKFNGKKPVPYLKSINLNGRLICPSSRENKQKTTTKRPVYENPGDLHQNTRRTTPQYQEGPKRPVNFVEEYESNTRRTTAYTERRPTTPYEDVNRKTTPRPAPEYIRPNPNGYEETNQNSFGGPTKKPPGRPPHSNGKPPPHAAKPAQGIKPGNGQGHGHGHNKNQNSPGGNKPAPAAPTGGQGPPQQKQILCGTPSVQPRPLITHGQLTSRGQWPWHVALYKNVGTDLTFFCGGSLLNTNYVLTAAHCVTKTYTTKPLDENTLVVYLGKYHLKLWSEGGVQNRQVNKIYVHPKYNSTDFRSDIAVLALSSPVEYTDYIRPICLWDRSNTRIEDVEGKEGTVVGWGFDENKKLTEELRQAKMPVVEQKTCLWSYPEFYPQFTSNMTYCAGFKNGTSVCNGDSGGGMVFPYKDSSGVERWHLRGIVSISPARNDSRVCDPTHYVVFTDVAKFLPWLDNFV